MGLFGKKDYVKKWLDMSDEDKIRLIQSTYNGVVEGHVRTKYIKSSPQDVTALIEELKQIAVDEGWFATFAERITKGYLKSGQNKSPNKVVRTWVTNYIKSYLNQLSLQPEKSNGGGCVKCGSLEFEYDDYFNEYVCGNCGWTTTEKPNGEIKITSKEAATTTEKLSVEKNKENTSQSMSIEEANKIINEYGAVMEAKSPEHNYAIDVSKLPCEKNIIKSAIELLLKSKNCEDIADALKYGYTDLATWQEGVGETIKVPTTDVVMYNVNKNEDDFEQTAQFMKIDLKLVEQYKQWWPVIKAETDNLQQELDNFGL